MRAGRHRQVGRDLAGRDVLQQPHAQRVGELPADHVLGVRDGRDGPQGAIRAQQGLLPDEGQRELPAAARGAGRRDEDVDAGLAAIAHVVHEGDLLAEEVGKAVLAVEEDLEPRTGRRPGHAGLAGLSRPAHLGKTDDGEARQAQTDAGCRYDQGILRCQDTLIAGMGR